MLKRLLSIWKEYRDESNILVYQPGKVGSTSLELSINNSIHFHTLFGNSPCHPHIKQRRSGIRLQLLGWVGDCIKRIAIKKRKETKIITLVRDPVSRNISMFFQDLPHWIYYHMGKGYHDNRFVSLSFLEKVFYESFDHDYIDSWFDKEIKRLTKINVFEYNFSKKKGYLEIREGNYSILLLYVNSLSQHENIISKFIGKKISITNSNESSNKWYGCVYESFKKDIEIKPEYLLRMHSTQYNKKFFND